MTTRPLIRLVGAAIVALAAPDAFGQDACPDAARAATLEDQGRAARQSQHDEEALELFRRSWALCHAPRSLARVALAEAALGRWLDAEAHLTESLGVVGDPWIEGNRAELEGALSGVRRRLGDLTLAGDRPSSSVELNGRPAGRWPEQRRYRVVAGTVVIGIRSPGHVDFLRTIEVAGGGMAREEVLLVRRPSERDAVTPSEAGARGGQAVAPTAETRLPPTRSSQPGVSALRIAGWATVAGAAVAAAVGLTGTLLQGSAFSEYEGAECAAVRAGAPVDEATYAQCSAYRDEGIARQRRNDALQLGGYIASGALAVTGAVLLFLPAPARRSAMWCAPSVAHPGVACALRF